MSDVEQVLLTLRTSEITPVFNKVCAALIFCGVFDMLLFVVWSVFVLGHGIVIFVSTLEFEYAYGIFHLYFVIKSVYGEASVV